MAVVPKESVRQDRATKRVASTGKVIFKTSDFSNISCFKIKLISKFFVEWGINENRLNKIKLAEKFMDRFTTKFCGFGTLTQDIADGWYATLSDLETAGQELLETYLADCKEKVLTKAKTKDRFEISIIYA